jgi:hypothetical protein
MANVMKVSNQLTNVLKQACKEVNSWDQWQRSLDPLGSQIENTGGKNKTRRSDPQSTTTNKQAVRER